MALNLKKPTLIEEVRRRQIVDAAIETIALRGFSKTTLNDIAKQAGVSTGVITYHFKNKDDLIEQSIKKLLEAPNSYVVARVDAQSTHPERLRAYILANIEFMRDHRSQSVALIYSFGSIGHPTGGSGQTAGSGSEQERHRVMARQHARIRKYLTKILKAGQEAGEFGAFHADTIAQILFAALEGIILQWVFDEEAIDLGLFADELIQIAERHVLPGQ